mmetsp:Transcript_11401/g.19161  ORF Transcript_11401/g.19161 Transcript_11401/m.19161 type:complete len:356 (-) Transcript_11401:309-1376(-)
MGNSNSRRPGSPAEPRRQYRGPGQTVASTAPSGYPGAQYPGAAQQPNSLTMQQGGQRMPLPQVQQYFLEGYRPQDVSYLNFSRQAIPQPPMQKTHTIRNDVNLKKNTLQLIRDEQNAQHYHIKFTFDASTACCVSIYYAAVEQTELGGVSFLPENGGHPKQNFQKGLGQTFCTLPEHALDASLFTPEKLTHDAATGRFPVVICLEVAASASASSTVQSQTTFANLLQSPDGDELRAIQPIKQKIQVGSSSYELQEIFGIDGQKSAEPFAADASGNAADDCGLADGRECVICMTDARDTTVLPCRHMCMCSACAKVLRLQSNKCPICRSGIESLLQIKITKEAASTPAGKDLGPTT